MPAMSSPITCAASMARAATWGWTRSVTSMAVPPVLRLPLRRISTIVPAGGSESGVSPCSVSTARAMVSSLILLRTVA